MSEKVPVLHRSDYLFEFCFTTVFTPPIMVVSSDILIISTSIISPPLPPLMNAEPAQDISHRSNPLM